MRREKITWLVVLLLVVGSALLVWMVASRPPKWLKFEQKKPDLSLRISSDYARDIKIVIDGYLTQRMNYGDGKQADTMKSWSELTAKTQSALLKLKVPAKRTELHLALVLELNNIKDALESNDLDNAQAAEIRLIKLFGQI